MSFRNQFAHPHGLGGRAAGWIMTVQNTRRNRWVLDRLDPQPGEHLLEIGCGPGVAVAEAVTLGSRVTADDPSAAMRSMASRRNAAAIADGWVEIVDGSAEALPEGPFAAAYAVNTPQFWADVDSTLAEVVERLGPEGRMALAIQPRFKGATDADARQLAEENADRLVRAGFGDVRVHVLSLRPTDVGCAVGRLR
jgi:cyclopropane fatty-acyl-phospholipid synthase-like methyltransferase